MYESASPAVPLEAILCTAELQRRSARPADLRAENRALLHLARHLSRAPRSVLQEVSEVTIELLGADSAGISLLNDDRTAFHWPAIAGTWTQYLGGTVAREASPCGLVVERGATQLLRRPEAHFQHLAIEGGPRNEEVLLAPFAANDLVVGTVWAVAHDPARHFDAEDQRLLESLATFAATAYQVVRSLDALDSERLALHESQDRLAFALEASHTGAWELDLANRVAYGSPEHDRIFGYAKNTPFSNYKDFLACVVPEDQARVDAAFQRAVATRSDWNFECRIRRGDGALRWIWAAGRHRDDGSRMAGIVRDITAQKLVEQAAMSSQLQLRNELQAMTRLHELVGRLLVCTDLRTALDEVLSATIELIGADMGNVQLFDPERQVLMVVAHRGFGRGFLDYFQEIPLDSGVSSARATRTRQRVIVRDVLEDEGFRPHLHIVKPAGYRAVQSTPLLGSGGKLLGVLSTHFAEPHEPSAHDLRLADLYARQAADFIERMQTSVALRESAARLELADRRKDEFLATLAHELRNPLGPIRHAAKLSKLPQATHAQVQWAHEVIDRQVEHMARLLDDLLEVSRITRGTLELRKERLHLGENLVAAAETVRPLIEARGHVLHVEVPEQAVFVEADPVRFAQIFSNLLSNAAKYTDPGGRITLQVRIEVASVVVAVRDTGIGIGPDLLPRVFDMFSQATSALHRSEGGLGIGLSLARGLVSLHGGTIEAHSDGLGRGSEFVVTLPIVDMEAPMTQARTAHAAAPSGDARRLRILVADDNQDNVDTWAALLALDGHDVRSAYSGTQAFSVAEQVRPDLALLDIGMPGMNGYELARRIRATDWGRNVVLVAVTGWGQAEDKRQAQEAGFDRHLSKPVGPDALEPLVELVRERRAVRQ